MEFLRRWGARIPTPKLTLSALLAVAVFVAKELASEFAADWLKSNLWVIGDILAWRWSSAILAVAVLLVVWAFLQAIERRHPRIALGGPTTTSSAAAPPEGRDIEKGLLDFRRDAERSVKQYGRMLRDVTTQTESVTKKIRTHAKRAEAARGTTEMAHSVASRAAEDFDKYSHFIEAKLSPLKETTDLFGDSYIAYIEGITPQTQGHRSQLAGFRQTVEHFQEVTTGARKEAEGFRDSVVGLRQRGISQALNRASARLVSALNGVIAAMRSTEGSCTRLLSVIDWKLR